MRPGQSYERPSFRLILKLFRGDVFEPQNVDYGVIITPRFPL